MLKTKLDEEDFDYIVVGAGVGGCVVASRLSENPATTVLLLEAGGDDRDVPPVREVRRFREVLWTDANWKYETVKQKHVNQARKGTSIWTHGKLLGGTSTHNGAVYKRGVNEDYDFWANELGCEGWDSKTCLKYFMKSEGSSIARHDPKYHGRDGPLIISEEKNIHHVVRAFRDACVSSGSLFTDDSNGKDRRGVCFAQTTSKNQKRCSASDAFIRPNLGRPNLTVILHAHVTRIMVDKERRAFGVKYCSTHPDSDGKEDQLARARHEVIVSCGVINSPQLLLLSGIGPKQDLEKFDIPCIADLPVGKYLQDQVAVGIVYANDEEIPSEWISGSQVISLCSTGSRPDLESRNIPDVNIYLDVTQRPHLFSREHSGMTFFTLTEVLHPRSMGYVRLKSRNPFDDPIIDPNYLDHPDDRKTLLAGLKKCIEIRNQPCFQKFKGTPREQVNCPHRFGSDEYLKWMIRNYATCTWHAGGSCKMGPEGSSCVVDTELRVKGIKSLRVVDSSVFPSPVSANPQATVYMIAEKAADMIIDARKTGSKL